MKAFISVVLAGVVAGATTVSAQNAEVAPAARQKQLRYQIGQMERVLEGAVEHGAKEMRDRLQVVLPSEMTMVTDNARVRGFRLDGYGVFFDVVVPSLLETVPWSFFTLGRNDLDLERALSALRTRVRGDAGLEQALERVELQLPVPGVRPREAAGQTRSDAGGGRGGVSALVAPPDARSAPAAPASDAEKVNAVLVNPEEAYRTEVKQALMDAMLDHSASLGLAGDEWLTVAARRSDDRPRLAPADSDAQTVVIRVLGRDLLAFLARQLPREEALKRIEVRVF